MMYDYRCPECDLAYSSPTRADRLDNPCACGFEGPLHRVFGFSHKPAMPEHYNHAVGKPISNPAQFRSELSRASDEATARTGMEHRFAPIDIRDIGPDPSADLRPPPVP